MNKLAATNARVAMLPEKRTKTNIGVGIGLVLQLGGLLLFREGETRALFGLLFVLLSLPVFVWGCMHYAEGKGHSKWVGVVGLAGIVGLIVLFVLPDQRVWSKNSADACTPTPKDFETRLGR